MRRRGTASGDHRDVVTAEPPAGNDKRTHWSRQT